MNENIVGAHPYERQSIEIHTLGCFSIRFGGQSFEHLFESAPKMLELLKFFITYRNENLLTERIIDEIWPEADFSDPNRTLRALVFRLRKVFKGIDAEIGTRIISFANRCYRFNAKQLCTIDIDHFEQLFKHASESTLHERETAIMTYIKLIKSYKGGYFCETSSFDWLVPFKNQYHHMYLHSCNEVLEYLSGENRYQEIVDLSEEIIKHDLYFEHVHQYYIESLVSLGESKHAQNHLEYLKRIFDRELGIHATEIIKSMYDALNHKNPANNSIDLKKRVNFMKIITETSGPVLCDYEFFKLYRRIEECRVERCKQKSFWGTISLVTESNELKVHEAGPNDACSFQNHSPHTLKVVVNDLRAILAANLRKGDVIAQKSEYEFAISLFTGDEAYAERALERIHQKFNSNRMASGFKIKSERFPVKSKSNIE